MSIIRLLINNIQGGSITLPYPQRPPIQSDYRGMVQNAPDQCTGCALCAYVCTSSAITVQRAADGFRWSYDPAQCTYCARCTQRCPKGSLTMQDTRPPIYQQLGGLKQYHDVRKKKKAAVIPPSSPQPVEVN